jgi:hypothetical protein
MAQVLQLRRGTTAQSDAFTGAIAEVSVDTDRDSLRVHDGTTMGGKEIAPLQVAVPLLPAASSVATSDELPIIQGGVARRATKTQILNGIVDSNISASAAIAGSKLADGAITDAKVNASAAIALSKLATGALPAAITVATANIVDANVTDAKIASGVDASKLTTGTLPIACIANAAITPAKLSQPLTLATAVATTSGTSIDFTGIPSWAKRITLIFSNVSTNGNSPLLVQIGAGSVQTSGYNSSGGAFNYVNQTAGATSSAGFYMLNNAIYTTCGHMLLTLLGGSFWVSSHALFSGNSGVGGGVSPNLSGALDRVRITTTGSDTFDGGSVNIIYEG